MKIEYFTADEEAEAWIDATLKRAERAYETAAKLEAASKFAEDNEWIAARIAARGANDNKQSGTQAAQHDWP